jgi:hypothetical protein
MGADYAISFSPEVVGDSVAFHDGKDLVVRPLGAGKPRVITCDVAGMDLWYYVPGDKGDWVLGYAAANGKGSLLRVVNAQGATTFQKHYVEDNILLQPVLVRGNKLYANYFEYKGARSKDTLVDFGCLILDTATGKTLAQRELNAIVSYSVPQTLPYGFLPARRGYNFSLPGMPVEKSKQLNTADYPFLDLTALSNAFGESEFTQLRLVAAPAAAGEPVKQAYVTSHILSKLDLVERKVLWEMRAYNGRITEANLIGNRIVMPSPRRDQEGNVIFEAGDLRK